MKKGGGMRQKYCFTDNWDVIRRFCNKDRDQGQKGIGVRYRSCSDIQYKGKYGLRHLFIYSVHSSGVCKQ